MTGVLVLRPQPGAQATAERARALGLEPIVAPLFTLEPLAWTAPDLDDFDAVMLTSAAAPRLAGPGLAAFLALPCYAVGDATAQAASAAGFAAIVTGASDGACLVEMMAERAVRHAFHPCGRDMAPLPNGGVGRLDLPVYAAEPSGPLAGDALAAAEAGAIALVHSPRAAARFADLVGSRRARMSIVAISAKAAAAAGGGWKSVAIAETPRDSALLELALKLCQTGLA